MPHPGLTHVLDRITAAARTAGRRPDEVTLIAVSKTFPAEEIEPVLAAGQLVFGENRVQEAKSKWPKLLTARPNVRLHLIGPLQSNKAADAVRLFDAIHTVDRPRIAEALAAEMKRQARKPQLFVQVNTGDEPQKAGISLSGADAFIAQCRNDHGLEIAGLMCIPPVIEDPATHFRLLADLARRNRLPFLSMGMSGDFEAAIAMGATHVRVGSAIFGHRPPIKA
jgi:pyridoxal phosphate enzyme (YggS family)